MSLAPLRPFDTVPGEIPNLFAMSLIVAIIPPGITNFVIVQSYHS